MSGFAAMTRQIAKVRALGGLALEAAREAAPRLLEAARATAAGASGPDGEPWAPRKNGGGAALLKNAPSSISVIASTALVVLIVRGHHFFHTTGRGSPRRRIIPGADDPMPAAYAEALRASASSAFRRIVR